MADISFTITADPQQAVQAIDMVKSSAAALQTVARDVASESGQIGSDSVERILSVSDSTLRSVADTISAVGELASTASGVAGSIDQTAQSVASLQDSASTVSDSLTISLSGVSGAASGVADAMQQTAQGVASLTVSAESAMQGAGEAGSAASAQVITVSGEAQKSAGTSLAAVGRLTGAIGETGVTVKKVASDLALTAKGVDAVTASTDALSVSVRNVAQNAGQSGANAVSQVLTVTNQAQRSVNATMGSLGGLSNDIREVARAATSVSGALGQSIPVIGKIGIALQSVISGPIGIITAIITATIAKIRSMILEAEEIKRTMGAREETQADTARQELERGRREFAQQMDLVKQVRELSGLASASGLDKSEVAQLRRLAEQIGIDRKDVSASGVKESAIDKAVEKLTHDREGRAAAEYQDYINKLDIALNTAIDQADLNEWGKSSLKSEDVFGKLEKLQLRVRSGMGLNTTEQAEYKRLLDIVQPLEAIAEAYKADPLYGRSQEERVRADIAAIKDGVKTRDDEQSARAATQRTMEERTRRELAVFEKLNNEIQIQELINSNKKREAYILQQRIDAESRIGHELDPLSLRNLEAAAGKLYDMRNPAQASSGRSPELDAAEKRLRDEIAVQELQAKGLTREAEILRQRLALESYIGEKLDKDEASRFEELVGKLFDLRNPAQEQAANAFSMEDSARRAAEAYRTPLDRLQQIGANVTQPALSRDSNTLNRQLTVQESILTSVRNLATSQFTSSNSLRFP